MSSASGDGERRSRRTPRTAPRSDRRRGRTRQGDAPEALELSLSYRPPLDWRALLAFLARRTVAGVEHVADDVYLRTVRVEQDGAAHSGWMAVRPAQHDATLLVALSPSLSRAISAVLARAARAFDLSCDPGKVAAALGELGARNPGLRLPGAFDGFEAAVRGILGQQVTVKSAHTLAGRFAAAFGEPVATPHPALRFAFPAPHRIAALDPAQIAALGVVGARATAIVSIARAIAEGQLRLEPTADVSATLEALRAIRGIGEWTAQYIAMRALAWPDAFPHSDYGVLKALGETDPRRALQRAEAWRPWRAYAVMHLWKSLEGT
jgi:AraC family transcriptional regulator of adaptative response / DNA-3-methyladenine glycosylase II